MAQDIFAISPDMGARQRWALQQLQAGSDATPVHHPLQALARAIQGAIGGYTSYQNDQADREAGAAMFNSLPGIGSAPSPSPSPSPADTSATPQSTPSAPSSNYAPQLASAQERYGISPQYLAKMIQVESGGRPNLVNPTSRAAGLTQFVPGTWKQYGQGQDPLNPAANIDAAARYTADNMAGFRSKMGRDPSFGESYLAHQQGLGGATALLQNPNMNVVDALAPAYGGDRSRAAQAIASNGGSLQETAGQFAQRWMSKFAQPPVQVASLGGMPSAPPMPGAPPAQMAQNGVPGAMPPQALNAAVPNRSSVQIPPDVQATIRQLGADPRTRPQALQLYMQYAKPVEQYQQGVNSNGVPFQRNSVTGEIKADPTRDAAINEAEYARQNWQKLGFPNPASTVPNDQKFWQDFNAKRLGGPSTNVTVDNRAENEFAKEGGKLTAQRYNSMVEDVPQAKQMLSDVQTLTTLGRQIGTGKEAEVKAALGPYAQALGIDIKGLGEIQAYESIVNRVGPSLRVKGSGAQSDYELKNFLKSLPTLGNTQEGNELAGRVMQGIYQNKLKAGEIASAALNGEITRKEADKQLRDLPDPMQEYRDYVKKNPGSSIRPTDDGGWTVIDGVKIREKK